MRLTVEGIRQMVGRVKLAIQIRQFFVTASEH